MAGETVEQAFELLGGGDVARHNDRIAHAIRRATQAQPADGVPAQLSMTGFKLAHPNCINDFGLDVLTSRQTGFQQVAKVLHSTPRPQTSR